MGGVSGEIGEAADAGDVRGFVGGEGEVEVDGPGGVDD